MPIVLTHLIDEPQERLGFTVADVRQMLKAGILDDEGRYELLGGEIVPMQAHNPPHMRIKRWLYRTITLALGEAYWVDSESTLYLSEARDFVLPDVFVYPTHFNAEDVRGPDILWLIEVADTTLKKDRVRKAKLYARFGVSEYWVIDAQSMTTWVYRDPMNGVYPPETQHPAGERVAPRAFPHLALDIRHAP